MQNYSPETTTLNKQCLDDITDNKHQAAKWLIIHAYSVDKGLPPLLSDEMVDRLKDVIYSVHSDLNEKLKDFLKLEDGDVIVKTYGKEVSYAYDALAKNLKE